MKLIEEPSAANVQKQVYNRNVGGRLNVSEEWSVPAGVAWAVCGTVVVDSVSPDDVPTLRAAIGQLAEVVAAQAICWGRQPSVQLPEHDAVLHVTVDLSQTVATGGEHSFQQASRFHQLTLIPPSRKWVVWALRVPSPLDQAAVTALEAAVQSVPGSAVHGLMAPQ